MGGVAIPAVRVPGRPWKAAPAPDMRMPKRNYTPITIKLITTTNEQVERLLSMFRQQVDPERVVATLESWPAKLIWIHILTEPIALRGLRRQEAMVN